MEDHLNDTIRHVAALKRQKNPLLKGQLAEQALASALKCLASMAEEIRALKSAIQSYES